MKSLLIESENCLLSKNSYDINLNGKEIGELVKENLPTELEDYKNYPIKVTINIEFLGQEGINVVATGYEIEDEKVEGEE